MRHEYYPQSFGTFEPFEPFEPFDPFGPFGPFGSQSDDVRVRRLLVRHGLSVVVRAAQGRQVTTGARTTGPDANSGSFSMVMNCIDHRPPT
jgi:hypothetical protein